MKCCECGQLLAPVIEHVGPKNCGCKKIAEEMIRNGTVKKIKEEKGNLKYDYFILLTNPKTTSY